MYSYLVLLALLFLIKIQGYSIVPVHKESYKPPANIYEGWDPEEDNSTNVETGVKLLDSEDEQDASSDSESNVETGVKLLDSEDEQEDFSSNSESNETLIAMCQELFTKGMLDTQTITTTTLATTTSTSDPTTTSTSDPTTTTPTPGAIVFSCNFENGMCSLEQDDTDKGNWHRFNLASGTSHTGPNHAYSGSYYIYTEASEMNQGDISRIYSPSLTSSGTQCLRFRMHMYGDGMGTLLIFLNGEAGRRDVFIAQGDKGNQWLEVAVTLFGQQGDKIGFEVKRGRNAHSNIALDDIIVTSGGCQV